MEKENERAMKAIRVVTPVVYVSASPNFSNFYRTE